MPSQKRILSFRRQRSAQQLQPLGHAGTAAAVQAGGCWREPQGSGSHQGTSGRTGGEQGEVARPPAIAGGMPGMVPNPPHPMRPGRPARKAKRPHWAARLASGRRLCGARSIEPSGPSDLLRCCTGRAAVRLEQPDELGRLFRRRALLLLSALHRQLLEVIREHLDGVDRGGFWSELVGWLVEG